MLLCPRVVGRAVELERLRGVIAGAARGDGQAVVVDGEAGIGKSALLRAAVPADRTVVGRAVPGTASTAVVEWITALVGAGADPGAGQLGAHQAILATMVPGLFGAGADGAPHPVTVADAVLRLWATLPVPRRPVLVFEDAHWIDEGTGATLRRVLERGPGRGMVVVVTTRPDGPFWPVLQRLVEARDATALALGPLRDGDVATMVQACLGVPEMPDGVLEQVADAGGRPLLVEEVLAELAGSGLLRRDAEGWVVTPGRVGVPASVRAGARSRLAGLTGPVRRVVERAAVFGAEVDTGLLGASVGMSADQLAGALDAGAAAGLLDIDPGSGTPAFRHELLREAVLAGLLDVQRREHARDLLIAAGATDDPAWVERVPGERLGLVARLAGIAGDPDLAGLLSLRHAHRLVARGRPAAAADAAERAATSPGVTTAALAVLVEAYALGGEVDRALAAADRYEARPDAAPGPRVRLAVARAVAEQGDWARADATLATVRGPDEPAEVTALAALIELELGRYAPAEQTAQRLLSGPVGAPTCQAMEVLGRLARRVDLAAAQVWFRRAAEAAESAGLALWRARALHEEATVAQLRTLDIDRLWVARRAAVEAGAPGLVSTVDFHLAAVQGVRFESGPALEAARRLLVDARALGAARQEAWGWVLVGQAHAVGGSRAQADAAAAEALSRAPDDMEIRGLALAECRGLAALLADDAAAGVDDWRAGIEALRQFRSSGPMPPWYLWPVLATVTDPDQDGGVRARAETARPDLRTGPGPEALWHLGAAVAAGRAGDLAAANRAAGRAEELFAGIPAFAGWRHLGHRWVVEDAITTGWGAPDRWAADATRWFDAAGFAELAAACRGLARRAGVPGRRRGRGASEVPDDLARMGVTSREVDVLRLLADGLTNSEIAARLYLSPRTVKGYVEQLLAKTGAANRTQLARKHAR